MTLSVTVPSPELWWHADAAEAEDGLRRRVEFFISTLGYDPENVAILTAFSDGVSRVRNLLKEAGIETVDIREKSFDFESTRGGARFDNALGKRRRVPGGDALRTGASKTGRCVVADR